MNRLLVFFLIFFSLGSTAYAVESGSCENSFHQWMPAGDHPGLHNSAYGIEWTKLGSIFITKKAGLPYYSPVWYLGVFTHSYPAVVLEEGGALQATAGSFGFLNKDEVLYLVDQSIRPSEVRLKFLTKKKFSVKVGDPKETDRVSLELVIPKGSGWCNAQRYLEAWVKGFGGLLEAERYQQIGDRPPPPGVPPETPATKVKKSKEVKQETEKEERVKATEETAPPEPRTPVAPPSSEPPPAAIPSSPSKTKPIDPTSAEALYPPRETDLKSGMSRSEVDAKLGKPIQVVKLGEKTICYYEDVMVEFVKDRLTDIHLSDRPSPSVLKRYH